MKKIIDSQGRLFGEINIFDFLAIVLIFIVIFVGIFKIKDFLEYRKRRIELKKQQELLKLKSIKNKEAYFIAYNVPEKLLKYFVPGKELYKNLQIEDILWKANSLHYYKKDSILDCSLYKKDRNWYTVIFRGKISLYEYNKDSIFFNDMKYIKGNSYKINLKDKEFSFYEIEYSNDFYYVDKNYVIKNVSPELAHLIEKGLVFYNNYQDTIGVVKKILSKTQTYSYENILKERSKLYSNNLDINVKLRLKLYKYNNKIFLNNLRPLSSGFGAFLKRDSVNFAYTVFSLIFFDDKSDKETEFNFLRCNMVIHGLKKEELSSFRDGMVFFDEKGDTGGVLKRIFHKGFDYFYDNRFIQYKKDFQIDFGKDIYCIIGQVDLVYKQVNNNIYFNKYIIYPHINSFAKAVFPIKGINTIKDCNIFFDNLEYSNKTKFIVMFSDAISLPADIISYENGYSSVGRILKKLDNNRYLLKLKINYNSGFYYFGENVIYISKGYNFLIRNSSKIFSNYGYFVPNKKISLVLQSNALPEREDFNRLSDYVKIVNIDNNLKQLELLLEVLEIGNKYYYSSGGPLPAVGMNITIDTRAGRLNGKIIRRNNADN